MRVSLLAVCREDWVMGMMIKNTRCLTTSFPSMLLSKENPVSYVTIVGWIQPQSLLEHWGMEDQNVKAVFKAIVTRQEYHTILTKRI